MNKSSTEVSAMSQDTYKARILVFLSYIKDFFCFARFKLVVYGLLTLIGCIGQGISIFMLIPVFRLLSGENVFSQDANLMTDFIVKPIQSIGIPFTLGAVLVFYFLMTVFLKFASYAQSVLGTSLQNRYSSRLRCELFRGMLFAEWSFTSGQKSSNIAHVLTNDIPRVSGGTFFFMQSIVGLFFTISYFVWAFIISVELTFLVILIFLCVFILLKSYFPEAFDKSAVSRKALSGIYGLLLDHLNGLKIAKSYCMEKKEYDDFEKLSENISHSSLNSSIVSTRTSTIFAILSTFFVCLFIYLAFYYLRLPPEQIIVIFIVFSRLIPSIISLQSAIQQIAGMLPSFLAMKDLISLFEKNNEKVTEEQFISESSIRMKEKIAFENVFFSYEKNNSGFSIRNLSFEIQKGKITAIVGPSGSGKSTIADLLSGLLKPDSGKFLIDGKELDLNNLYSWKRKVGYMIQELFLFHDTIRNNLLKGKPDATEKEMYEALKLANAYDLVNSLPEKLDTVIKDRGLRLSGGERQRIALARTLLRKPELLIMDEATNALDVKSEEIILNDLKKLSGQYTILVISHKPSIVSFADKVIQISNGEIETALN